MKKIAFTLPDGRTAIVHPAPEARMPDESEDIFISRIMAADLPAEAIDPHIIDDAQMPADRTFRDAWKHTAGTIAVDMPKAREIQRSRMREARTPKLAALDVEYQRADEAGDSDRKKAVAARKQALRDVTKLPAIDAAQTPDALKSVWPDDLS